MAMENSTIWSASAAGLSPIYDVNGLTTVTIGVQYAAFTATLTIAGSMDGVNFVTLPVMNTNANPTTGGTFAPGGGSFTSIYQVNTLGATHLRLQISSYISGSLTAYVNLNGSNSASSVVAIGNSPTVNNSPTTNSNNQYVNSAASTNSTLFTGGPITMFSINMFNNGATVAYVKLYNKITAPTVGTDTPVIVYAVPSNGHVVADYAMGVRFTVGCGIGITGGSADSDTTAVAAGQVKVNFGGR
jgi:hypothetical protein